MNEQQSHFKLDFLDSVFSLSGKTWWKLTIGYALMSIAMMVPTFFIMKNIIGDDYQTMMSGQMEPQDMLDMWSGFSLGTGQFVQIGILVIFTLILSMWFLNFTLFVTNQAVNGETIDFKESIRATLSTKVFIFLLFVLFLWLILVAGIFAVAMLGSILTALAVIGGILLWVLLFKFLLVPPVLALDTNDLFQAVGYSFQTITWKKAMKYALIGFLLFLGVALLMFLIQMITSLFAKIPGVGFGIQMIIQFVVYGYFNALLGAALIGFYYRYKTDDELESVDMYED